MAASTGPILAAAGIVIFNNVIVNDKPAEDQFRIVVGAFITSAGLSLVERALPSTAVVFAWAVLVGTLLVRIDKDTPTPLESLQRWYST